MKIPTLKMPRVRIKPEPLRFYPEELRRLEAANWSGQWDVAEKILQEVRDRNALFAGLTLREKTRPGGRKTAPGYKGISPCIGV